MTQGVAGSFSRLGEWVTGDPVIPPASEFLCKSPGRQSPLGFNSPAKTAGSAQSENARTPNPRTLTIADPGASAEIPTPRRAIAGVHPAGEIIESPSLWASAIP